MSAVGGRADRVLGRCIRRERILAGRSREALSAALGVGTETMRRYEHGEERIEARQLSHLAAELRVPLSYLCLAEESSTASADAEDGPVRWIAAPRPLALLSSPAFAGARPLLQQWRESRGELSPELWRALSSGSLGRRLILARAASDGDRLITQHFGAGIAVLRPCESLLVLEREFAAHHRDADYSAWVAGAYAETLWRRRPRLESIRALIRMGSAATLVGRYDRLIIPWCSGRSDRFVMALSIQRAAPILVS